LKGSGFIGAIFIGIDFSFTFIISRGAWGII